MLFLRRTDSFKKGKQIVLYNIIDEYGSDVKWLLMADK